MHSQVVVGNLSVSIIGQVEFCMETLLWYAKFAAATLLKGQVVADVSWLMFLDPRICIHLVICQNLEGSLPLLVVENFTHGRFIIDLEGATPPSNLR